MEDWRCASRPPYCRFRIALICEPVNQIFPVNPGQSLVRCDMTMVCGHGHGPWWCAIHANTSRHHDTSDMTTGRRLEYGEWTSCMCDYGPWSCAESISVMVWTRVQPITTGHTHRLQAVITSLRHDYGPQTRVQPITTGHTRRLCAVITRLRHDYGP